MKRITFSLNMLFDGWDLEKNKQIADGRLFTLTELRGDWLWQQTIMEFYFIMESIDKYLLPL